MSSKRNLPHMTFHGTVFPRSNDLLPSRLDRWAGHAGHPQAGEPPCAVTGNDAGEIWVALLRSGSGGVAHYDGTTWSLQPTPHRLVDFHWTAGEELWAVGPSGVCRLADGSWESVHTSDHRALASIWAGSSNDIWVAGYRVAWHFDGSSWTEVTSDAPLESIWHSSLAFSLSYVAGDAPSSSGT